MSTTSTTLDAGQPRLSRPIRWLARAVEPVARPLAGTRVFPLWAVLRHTGRTSGRAYATPIVALRTPDGFLIPLPFGDATQWAKNLAAAGGGSLRHAGHDYAVAAPRIVEGDAAERHLPGPLALISRRLGLRQYVLVRNATR